VEGEGKGGWKGQEGRRSEGRGVEGPQFSQISGPAFANKIIPNPGRLNDMRERGISVDMVVYSVCTFEHCRLAEAQL